MAHRAPGYGDAGAAASRQRLTGFQPSKAIVPERLPGRSAGVTVEMSDLEKNLSQPLKDLSFTSALREAGTKSNGSGVKKARFVVEDDASADEDEDAAGISESDMPPRLATSRTRFESDEGLVARASDEVDEAEVTSSVIGRSKRGTPTSVGGASSYAKSFWDLSATLWRQSSRQTSRTIAETGWYCGASPYTMVKISVFCITLVLRWSTLVFYARHTWWLFFLSQLILEFIAMVLSLQVTVQDVDVLEYVNSCTSWSRKAAAGSAAVFVLGFLQVIHVKRAISSGKDRDFEQLERLGATDYLWSGPTLGGERSFASVLITGVPFALSALYTATAWEHGMWKAESGPYLDGEVIITTFAAIFAVMTLTFAVVDVDLAVSTYVASRYHFDPRRTGTRCGGHQFLYPLVHFTFRGLEVLLRTQLLVEFIVILTMWGGLAGEVTALLVLTIDVVLLSLILQHYAPESDQFVLHLLVAAPFSVANLARFVDRPGFHLPAKYVSRHVEHLRILEMVLLLLAMSPELIREGRRLGSENPYEQVGIGIIFYSALGYYALGRTPLDQKRHDLHSAVVCGDAKKVHKLLGMGSRGEALDPNALTKDRLRETPAGAGGEYARGLGPAVQSSVFAGSLPCDD